MRLPPSTSVKTWSPITAVFSREVPRNSTACWNDRLRGLAALGRAGIPVSREAGDAPSDHAVRQDAHLEAGALRALQPFEHRRIDVPAAPADQRVVEVEDEAFDALRTQRLEI